MWLKYGVSANNALICIYPGLEEKPTQQRIDSLEGIDS
jgi:hypothetical protein